MFKFLGSFRLNDWPYGYNPVSNLGSDLIAYWDAARTDLITKDESNLVSSWKDIKAGYDAVQATGMAKPVYGATSFNGAPSLLFDGVDDQLTYTMSGGEWPVGADPCELWVLTQQDALPADTTVRLFLGYGSTTSIGRNVGRSVVSGVNRTFINTGSGSGSVGATHTSANFSSRHLVRAVINADASNIIVDTIAATPANVVPATTGTRIRIGASAATSPGSTYYQGLIAVVMVTKPLSETKASALQDYLLARRNI